MRKNYLGGERSDFWVSVVFIPKTCKVSVCLRDLLPLKINVLQCNTLYNLKRHYTCSPQKPTVPVLNSACIKFQGLRLKTSVSSMSDLAGCTPVSNHELAYASIVTRSTKGTCCRCVKQCRWPGDTDEQRFDFEMKSTTRLPLPMPFQKPEHTRMLTYQIAVHNLT